MKIATTDGEQPMVRRAMTMVLLVGLALTPTPHVSAAGSATSTARRGVIPVSNPEVVGPIQADRVGAKSHNYPFGAAFQDLGGSGYVENEFFFSGTAAGQPYTSRMLVRRPAHAADFSGTVVTEWTNVSSGFDLDCLWARSADQLMRDGDAYVVVDAQTLGVNQAGTGLKAFSPERYASLDIPQSGTFVAELGSYDIFGQALQAIRHPRGVRPLGPLTVRHQIVTGCSQSAGTVSIYAASTGAAQGLADAYLLTELSTTSIDPSLPGVVFPVATPGLFGVPVLQLNTENDEGTLRTLPDSADYRLWEVAGATHVDLAAARYTERIALRDLELKPQPLGCVRPPLSRIPFAHVQNAALRGVKRWAIRGVEPPSLPQIRTRNGEIFRDRFGNAFGGIRLPEHAVATATNSRVNSGNDLCARLAGSHVPFSRTRLRGLYRSHAIYVRRFARATRAGVRAGFLLPHDAITSLRHARASHVPFGRSRR